MLSDTRAHLRPRSLRNLHTPPRAGFPHSHPLLDSCLPLHRGQINDRRDIHPLQNVPVQAEAHGVLPVMGILPPEPVEIPGFAAVPALGAPVRMLHARKGAACILPLRGHHDLPAGLLRLRPQDELICPLLQRPHRNFDDEPVVEIPSPFPIVILSGERMRPLRWRAQDMQPVDADMEREIVLLHLEPVEYEMARERARVVQNQILPNHHPTVQLLKP